MQDNTKWQKIGERLERVGEWRDVYHKTYRMPDGVIDDWVVVGKRPTACVFALTPDLQVICAKQFRPGPERVCFDLPGGYVDDGEEPQTAAARELLEETGYAGDVEYLAATPIGGTIGDIRWCFLATNCKKVAEPDHEEFEYIDIVLLGIEEMIKNTYEGKLTDPAGALFAIRELEKRGMLKTA